MAIYFVGTNCFGGTEEFVMQRTYARGSSYGLQPTNMPNVHPRICPSRTETYKEYDRGDHTSQLLSVRLNPQFLDKTDRMSKACAKKLLSNNP